MEIKAEIKKIYADFEAHWRSEKYKNLFHQFDRMRKEHPKKYPHSLGHYAIFYTPVYDQPEYMIIGNNPSWFDSNALDDPDAARTAKKEVIALEKQPPSENLYTAEKFDFGREMREIFANHLDVLDKIVGLNRLWVQTGGDHKRFKKHLSDKSAQDAFKNIEEICECRTRKIIVMLKPKAVFLFGDHAKKAFSDDFRKIYREFLISWDLISQDHKVFVDVRHPAHGGVPKATQTINEYFKNHPPSPQTP